MLDTMQMFCIHYSTQFFKIALLEYAQTSETLHILSTESKLESLPI